MKPPQYLKQIHNSACSIAVLRMVLASRGISVSEEKLIGKIEADYKKSFKQVWNPTIAKLACQNGVAVTFMARWSLLKPANIKKAKELYGSNKSAFDVFLFEEKDLDIAYRDMLTAIELGCEVSYGKLTSAMIEGHLAKGHYIQTSIHKNKLHKGAKAGYHSILLYDFKDGNVYFHDPDMGAALHCSIEVLMRAMNGAGAALVYYN